MRTKLTSFKKDFVWRLAVEHSASGLRVWVSRPFRFCRSLYQSLQARGAALPGKNDFWNLKTVRRCVVGLLLVQLIAVAIAAWQIKRQAQRELEAARAGVERQAIVPTDRKMLQPISGEGIKLMQNSKAVRSLARFNDSYFAATDGGLVQLSPEGKCKRRFTVLDGLPESDLTALSAFGSQLFIGTRSQGLVSFDGTRFTAYRWADRKVQAITSLVEDRARSGGLLIGTFAGGLLEFDGKQFRELKAEQKRIAGIETLSADGTQLFVATFSDGLWMNEAGRWSHLTIADGLPSNRVIGVVVSGEQLIVATDFGIATATANQTLNAAEASAKRFQTIVTLPSLASIARYGDSILLCKDNGEIVQLLTDAQAHRAQLNPLVWNRPAQKESTSFSSCQLRAFSGEPSLWLLSNEGLWRAGPRDDKTLSRLNFVSFGELTEPNGPTSNLVSALAFDSVGNLWVGSFRNGIDVFTREGRRITHLESDAVREINSLAWDEASKQMIAATAQGLIRFDARMQPRQLTTADGLLSNSVQHATPIRVSSSASSATPAEIVLATSRGLSFGPTGKNTNSWRALTTAQGLPSNSIYAVLPHREFIYAGTLNGLAQINGTRVVRIFNDSNSKLTHNWVTALQAVGSRLFVGTYGGGMFELMPSGEFASFVSEVGKLTVNPNAMTSDGQRLYIGTLDGAWALELNSQKWTRLKSELPAATVLSVTSDGENVYFGTSSGIARVNQKRLELVKE
jgi:ligand-binding sensor domain-containing protein